MNIPRELIYEEKKSLEQFGINDEKSINHTIYDNWLITRTDLITKSNLGLVQLKVFNDAYFICTTALMHQVNIEAKNYFLQNTDFHSVVFPLAYFLLSRVKNSQVDNSRLLKLIHTHIEACDGWKSNLDDINKLEIPQKKKIEASLFAPRKMTKEILSSVSWYKITDKYQTKAIKKIIYYFAKDLNERKMLAATIKEGAEEYEIGVLEDIDEDGNHYCIEEELIHLSKVYELCDSIIDGRNIIQCEMFPELKEQHEDLLDKTSEQPRTDSLIEDKQSLNYFAPQKNLQELLKQEWFKKVRASNQYDESWTDALVEALMSSEYGTQIARDWMKTDKRDKIKGYFLGTLKDAGIIKGGYDGLARKIDLIDKYRTFGRYMGEGKKKPYAKWVKEYVSNHQGAVSDK